MRRSQYLNALLSLFTVDEIRRSAALPSVVMTKTHIALHYIAIRRLGA